MYLVLAKQSLDIAPFREHLQKIFSRTQQNLKENGLQWVSIFNIDKIILLSSDYEIVFFLF